MRFVLNRVGQGAVVVAERVAAAGGAEALQQGARVGVEEDYLGLHLLVFQCLDDAFERQQLAGQVARVHAHRHPLGGVFLGVELFGEGGQQPQGQIVHAIVTVVLQGLQGGGFTRPGAAAENGELHKGATGKG